MQIVYIYKYVCASFSEAFVNIGCVKSVGEVFVEDFLEVKIEYRMRPGRNRDAYALAAARESLPSLGSRHSLELRHYR